MITKTINEIGYKTLLKKHGSIDKLSDEVLSNISYDTILKFDEKENNIFIDRCFIFWRKKGFPYDIFTQEKLRSSYKKMIAFDPKKIAKPNNEIGMNLTGLGIINSFFPEKYGVKCRKFRTPIDNFFDDIIFPKVLRKVISLSKDNPFKTSCCRAILKVFSGTHTASNFKPTVAKYLYQKYCPVGGKVLDPSMGYAGRMFGAITSHIGHYECCDPNTKTFKGAEEFKNKVVDLHKKSNKLAKFMGIKNDLPTVKMHNIPFEEYDNKEGTFDLVFTSPPYFNIEKYSDEGTQSWKNYTEFEDWEKYFLKKLISTSFKVLKNGGWFIINIAGKVGKADLEESLVRCATEVFGEIKLTEYMRLSKMVGTKKGGQGKNARSDFKLEPCFVFRKEI